MNEANVFSGIHAVLYALFREDETLDPDAMITQVNYCIANGCSGITVLGLATEVLKLTLRERVDLIGLVGEAVSSRVPFSVTIAGNSVAEQVELADEAQAAGADWLILQPPMTGNYNAVTYLDFFERVAGEIDLPLALQNAPQYLGRALSASDIARLRQRCENLVAVKSEEPALGVHQTIEAAGNGMNVLGGRGGLEMTDCLRSGCSGFVLAPDIAPVAAKIFQLWQNRQLDEAGQLYASATPAITFVMQSLEHLITYGKRIFARNAGLQVHDRSPCLQPTSHGLEMAERWADNLNRLMRENQ